MSTVWLVALRDDARHPAADRLLQPRLDGQRDAAGARRAGARPHAPGRRLLRRRRPDDAARRPASPRSPTGCPSTLVVFDNGRLGMVKLEQEQGGLPEFGTGWTTPTSPPSRAAMGLHGVRVEDADELDDAVREALAHRRPGAARRRHQPRRGRAPAEGQGRPTAGASRSRSSRRPSRAAETRWTSVALRGRRTLRAALRPRRGDGLPLAAPRGRGAAHPARRRRGLRARRARRWACRCCTRGPTGWRSGTTRRSAGASTCDPLAGRVVKADGETGLPIHGVLPAPWEVRRGDGTPAGRRAPPGRRPGLPRGVPVPAPDPARGRARARRAADRHHARGARGRGAGRLRLPPVPHAPGRRRARDCAVELPAMRRLELDASKIPTGETDEAAASAGVLGDRALRRRLRRRAPAARRSPSRAAGAASSCASRPATRARRSSRRPARTSSASSR